MLVLDASAVVEALLGTPRGRIVEARIAATHDGVYAPHLLDLEVVQALRRLVSQGVCTPLAGLMAIEDLVDMPIRRHPHEPFLQRIWELRHNASTYDASYLAMAEAYQATLVTADRKMTGVPGVEVTVALV